MSLWRSFRISLPQILYLYSSSEQALAWLNLLLSWNIYFKWHPTCSQRWIVNDSNLRFINHSSNGDFHLKMAGASSCSMIRVAFSLVCIFHHEIRDEWWRDEIAPLTSNKEANFLGMEGLGKNGEALTRWNQWNEPWNASVRSRFNYLIEGVIITACQSYSIHQNQPSFIIECHLCLFWATRGHFQTRRVLMRPGGESAKAVRRKSFLS